MTEFETKLIQVLEELPDRLAVALRTRRQKPRLVADGERTQKPKIDPREAASMRDTLSVLFRIVREDDEHTTGDWWRLGEIEKIAFPSKGIFQSSVVDYKRRKIVGAALRLMNAPERKRHGFSQFFLTLIRKEP